MPLRTALEEMPADDLRAHVMTLLDTPGTALRRHVHGPEWTWHDENTARLYEAMHYWLSDMAWPDRTTDPDDPDVRRARRDARESGARPPERPIIPPVAYRPDREADRRLAEYVQDMANWTGRPPSQLLDDERG